MALVTITIELQDASSDYEANERAGDLAHFLTHIAERQLEGFDDEIIRDYNGNRIGTIVYENWAFEE